MNAKVDGQAEVSDDEAALRKLGRRLVTARLSPPQLRASSATASRPSLQRNYNTHRRAVRLHPSQTMDVDDDPALAHAFTVESQRLELDFSFCPRLVKGKTRITIQPQSPKFKEIHLSCRQLKPTRVHLLRRDVAFEYNDEYDCLGLDRQQTIHQHHFLRNRVGRHEMQIEEELKIPIPSDLKIPTRRQQGSQELICDPIIVDIEYTLDNFRDGLHFVGTGEGDSRYPHVYTRNTVVPLFASSWFPCVDDGNTRIPFELSVRYPRTVADALSKSPAAATPTQTNGVQKADSVLDGSYGDTDLTEEEQALEMRAVCSGELTDTVSIL